MIGHMLVFQILHVQIGDGVTSTLKMKNKIVYRHLKYA